MLSPVAARSGCVGEWLLAREWAATMHDDA